MSDARILQAKTFVNTCCGLVRVASTHPWRIAAPAKCACISGVSESGHRIPVK